MYFPVKGWAKQTVQKVFLHSATIDFYLDWLELNFELQETKEETKVKYLQLTMTPCGYLH